MLPELLTTVSTTGGSILSGFNIPSYAVGVITGGIIVLVSIMIRSSKNKKRMRSEVEQTYEHLASHHKKMQSALDIVEDERKKALSELEHLKNDLTFPSVEDESDSDSTESKPTDPK
jgi:hypothetical protein